MKQPELSRRQRHPLIVEKSADDQRCNICLRAEILTEDHVPPKRCLSDRSVYLYGLKDLMLCDEVPAFYTRSQDGLRYRTLCGYCNNTLLGSYDNDLKVLVDAVSNFCESRLVLPRRSPELPLRCRPRAVLQSVLGHLLAAKSITDEQGTVDVALRPSILDPAAPIPDWIHVFYWLHPYHVVDVVRDIGMPAVRGRLWGSDFAMFSILKFYPIGFIVTDSSTYEGLASLDEFRAAPVELEADIKLPVDIVFSSDWPNNITADGNIIMAVDTFRDARRAVQVPRGQRSKHR
jgi:hypothetical protein